MSRAHRARRAPASRQDCRRSPSRRDCRRPPPATRVRTARSAGTAGARDQGTVRQVRGLECPGRHANRRSSMPLTQSQLVGEVADRAGLSKGDAKAVLDALEEVVLEQLGDAEKVKIGGVVQLTVRVKEATKARKGRNPATGEEITIAPKPASVTVKARPLTKAKAALPSVAAARRRIAA
ncbi:MAG: HU family DNA-binding protein [Gaiellaceae bacterium]